ncbi:NAD(P)-dependent oxidoreductase [Silicimonas sp. MF1-12-2]|uniref:NAD(P)-dependent oxidoreductase n=1 Tax=Silicimonas sp. MF1-12-2 TaxID=3384793 RepID=UPI0039B46999
MTKPAIGFIGLGLMGSAIVGRLQDKGYAITALANINRSGIDAALARGASEAANGREVAQASDIVMLCMGTSDHVESRMRGPDGVIAGLAPGKVVIDFGTSLPGSTIALGAEVAAAGAVMLDAPLGRTPSHARDGLLNIMASGDKATYDKVHPVLADLGENIFHLGPLGSGHTIKLINNFFGMTTANAMSEAFAMCDVAGVPRQSLYDVLAAGPNHSGMMDFVKAYALDGDPMKLAFTTRNGLKDISYYDRMASDYGADSIMAKCSKSALGRAVEDGRGDDLVPQMVDNFARWFKG